MAGGADDALVMGVAAIAVALLPAVSWLIGAVGEEISADVEGRRLGISVRRRRR